MNEIDFSLSMMDLLCTGWFSVSAQALFILGRRSSSKAEQSQINASKLLLFLNLSLTYLKLDCADRALKYGELALEMDQGNAKALFRCGQVSI